MTQEQQLQALFEFLTLIPEPILIESVSKIFPNRDARRKFDKIKPLDSKIRIVISKMEYRVSLIENLHRKYNGDIDNNESYEEILESINDSNHIERILYMLYRCCDDEFDKLHFSKFLKSEQFQKYTKKTQKRIDNNRLVQNVECNPMIDTETAMEEYNMENKENLKCYLGYIEIRGTYYNFWPQYVFSNGNVMPLHDPSGLFPKLGRFNLEYTRNKESQKFLASLNLDEINYLNNLYAVYVADNDIEDHSQEDTQKKFDLQKLYDNGTSFLNRIVSFDKLKMYKIVTPKVNIDNDAFNRIIEIHEEYNEGDLVLLKINDQEDSKFFGPYELQIRNHDGVKYIKPDSVSKQYILPYYINDDVELFGIEYYSSYPLYASYPIDEHQTIYIAFVSNDLQHQEDVIQDNALIERLKDNINIESHIDTPEEFVRLYSASPFLSNIPQEIREKRIDRVRVLLQNSQKYTEDIKNAVIAVIKDRKIDIKDLLDEVKTKEEYEDIETENRRLREENDSLDEKIRVLQNDIKVFKETTGGSVIDNKTIRVLEDQINELSEENAKMKVVYSKYQESEDLDEKVKKLKERYDVYYGDCKEKEQQLKDIQSKIKQAISEAGKDIMVKNIIDPFISNAMIEASNEWNSETDDEKYKIIVKEMQDFQCGTFDKTTLIEYLVNGVQRFRKYSRNDILNIYICLSQNFLTIFSGEPGTGKTSICNIVANSLGLNNFESENGISKNRYIPVSVERGWSSKRDLIGYFNPLTKKYDRSNAKIYDGLMILNKEQANSRFPYIIMLDEANLSPMEYYWADFMRATDNSDDDVYINIGLQEDIYIPKTLRFLATINNDQTTEQLSPRLIDRAWIIKLPKVDIKEINEQFKEVFGNVILWKDVKSAFIEPDSNKMSLETTLNEIYELFEKNNLAVSPRVRQSIKRYVCVAQDIMEDESKCTKEQKAIDYAVLQKLLPKINGYYNDFSNLFEALKSKCTNNNLHMTMKAIDDMEKHQNQNMGYCQYLI